MPLPPPPAKMSGLLCESRLVNILCCHSQSIREIVNFQNPWHCAHMALPTPQSHVKVRAFQVYKKKILKNPSSD